jgi:hypothetical protein
VSFASGFEARRRKLKSTCILFMVYSMYRQIHLLSFLLGMAFLCTLLCGCTQTSVEIPVDRQQVIPADAVKISPAEDAFPPVLHSQEFDVPIPLPEAVNTAGAEDSPFVTPDGQTLFFFFTPDTSIPAEQQVLDRVTGIYVSRRENGVLAPARRILLQDRGRLALDGCPFFQGDTLWFCSAREGYTGVHLFTAQRQESGWTNWQYTGDRIRDYEVGEMHLTADGKEMYFHSSRVGVKGGLDLWVTRLDGNGWQDPVNVAVVNTPSDEGWPFVTEDGRELWFTRIYQGSPAIFRSEQMANGWGEPVLILSSFAAEPTLDLQGNLYFAHHFIQNGTLVEADIYYARRK